jgi:hypothetical protein
MRNKQSQNPFLEPQALGTNPLEPGWRLIKKWAHAFTMLCVAWIGPDIFAAVAYYYGSQDSDTTWVSAAVWTWRIHAIWAVICVVLWVFERPQLVYFGVPLSDQEEIGD